MTSSDHIKHFIHAVRQMRDQQKKYYKAPSTHRLINAKQAEAAVDHYLKEITDSEIPKLL